MKLEEVIGRLHLYSYVLLDSSFNIVAVKPTESGAKITAELFNLKNFTIMPVTELRKMLQIQKSFN